MRTASEIAGALGGKRAGPGQWMARCPVHRDKTASLAIREGQCGPLVHCHAGCSQRDVIDELRRRGLWDAARRADKLRQKPESRAVSEPKPNAKPSQNSDSGTVSDQHQRAAKPAGEPESRHVSDDAERQRRIGFARRIWRESFDPRATVAEQYLNGRGLEIADDLVLRVLRFHPNCPWGKDEKLPCLIAAFRPIDEPDDDAPPTAILRIGLNADGKKIGKKMLGPVAGCAVKLDADENVGTGLGAAEGLETAMAVRATGWRPVWCLGSAGAIKTFPVLSGVEALTIFADHDANGVGMAAARDCAKRWQQAGAEVFIRTPRDVGADWADQP